MTDDFDYYQFLLNSTAEEWNEWRSQHPEIKLDWKYEQLQELNFRNYDLSGANLLGANLWGADLSGAELINTNLVGACLANTNLNNTVILLLIKALSSSDISVKNDAQDRILKMGLTPLIPELTQKYSQEINNIKGCLILLKSYPKENKNAIFGLALKIDLGLLETRNLIESVPVLLPVLFILKEGEKYQKSFEELGAIVTLVSC